MRISNMLMMGCIVLGTFVGGCRERMEGNMDLSTSSSSGGTGGSPDGTGGDSADAPDTWRDFPRLEGDDRPQDENPPEYATDIVVIAGCEPNPAEMAIVSHHQTEALCEHIVMQAARNNDGDFYEVGRPFTWGVQDPEVAGLLFPLGPKDELVSTIGKQDLFDGDGATEPRTAIFACAENECPTPRPADCNDMVCAMVEAVSVVDIEGAWAFSGASFEYPVLSSLMQDGRTFRDDAYVIEDGWVQGAMVRFWINDNVYDGTITPDRMHLSGQVRESMTDTLLGDWQADRAP